MKRFYFVLICLLSLGITSLKAQPGSLDLSFNANGVGPNDVVRTIVTQNDGKILIGGDFTTYNGVSRSKLARLNSDGTLDTGFTIGTGVNPNGSVKSIALQADGKILVAGYITNFNGILTNMMLRLNSDGSRDNSFTSLATNVINAVAVQADGKILIGGVFTSYGGTMNINRIARLNANGTLDNTFNTGTACNATVTCLTIQSDGKIIAGGGFLQYNGTSVSGLVRINTDGSYNSRLVTCDAYVRSLAMQGSGVFEKIIVAGEFTTVSGLPVGRIVRLNLDGTVEGSFHTNAGTGFGQTVEQVAVNPDNGHIAAVGGFSTYKGSPIAFGVTRINANGAPQTDFNPGEAGADAGLVSVAIQADGKILVGGMQTTYNEQTSKHLSRLHTACFVNIPDANFKSYLLGNASINTTNDGEIECSEAAAFTGSIECASLSISDLKGIEAFTEISSLNCRDNQLSSLDLSKNTKLTYLNCSANQLSSLDLNTNTVLTEVHAGNNQLSALNTSALTALVKLTVGSNSIGSLNLSSNAAITQLECEANSLTALSLANLTNLKQLYCSNNQLSSLDLSAQSGLTELDCNTNQLSSLDIANGNNTNLVLLWTYNNSALECIKVDDESYSTANWTNGNVNNEDPYLYDASTSFSEDCSGSGSGTSVAKVNAEIKVYPNPAQASVNISLNEAATVSFYTALGEQVYSATLNAGMNRIELDQLKPGIYFVQTLAGEAHYKTVKLIIQ
ncbi:MAG: T9SS type A sorting domain-containing protein [Bacteroidetes bacterium]|nr:MAG: T9SS type A sorting domain-containing protein [Bacteroidota bacterium]